MEKRIQSFEEFWPFYLSQHANKTCRNLHIFGSSLGVVFLISCLLTAHFALLPLTLVIGYGFAWIGHLVFEKNRPATFTYPQWSLQGDLRVLKLFYTGKLGAEIKKLQ